MSRVVPPVLPASLETVDTVIMGDHVIHNRWQSTPIWGSPLPLLDPLPPLLPLLHYPQGPPTLALRLTLVPRVLLLHVTPLLFPPSQPFSPHISQPSNMCPRVLGTAGPRLLVTAFHSLLIPLPTSPSGPGSSCWPNVC